MCTIQQERGFLVQDVTMTQFRLGELFCGPGGIGYAAVTARIRDSQSRIVHAWASDYDADTCKTYEKNVAKKGSVPNSLQQ